MLATLNYLKVWRKNGKKIGSAGNYSATNFMIKPQVGDFYVFPSDLFHCVYPFFTKGERRSFSANFNFVEMQKGTTNEVNS